MGFLRNLLISLAWIYFFKLVCPAGMSFCFHRFGRGLEESWCFHLDYWLDRMGGDYGDGNGVDQKEVDVREGIVGEEVEQQQYGVPPGHEGHRHEGDSYESYYHESSYLEGSNLLTSKTLTEQREMIRQGCLEEVAAGSRGEGDDGEDWQRLRDVCVEWLARNGAE